jgi:hypothetical protein
MPGLDPAQSAAKELVRSPAREWAGRRPGNPVIQAGQSLSYGLGGFEAPEEAAGVIAGAQALSWDQAVNKSAPNYDYDLTSPDVQPPYGSPLVYGTDPFGHTPTGGYNYWPGGAAGGGVCGTPGAESMMWLFTQAGCIGNYPNTPGDTLNPQQYFFRFCQASWWVYLKGWLSRITDGIAQDYHEGGYDSMTYAYRGRYKLDRYRVGFRANCELWAVNSSGAWGWDDYVLGIAEGVAPNYIGVMPRNTSLVGMITVPPGVYQEVPLPTGTSGSGTTEQGFLGLAAFDIWGISWAAWRTATGL